MIRQEIVWQKINQVFFILFTQNFQQIEKTYEPPTWQDQPSYYKDLDPLLYYTLTTYQTPADLSIQIENTNLSTKNR